MIDAVSKVSFLGETVGAQDLINAPGKFTAQAPIPAATTDSFEKTNIDEDKKSGNGLVAAISTAIAAIAIFAGLGYAVKTGKLEKVDLAKTEGFFNKALARIKNAGVYIGEKANNCYESTLGKWFSREAKDTKATT